MHVRSAAGTGEQAIAGTTRGLLGLHQEVTWRGRHFGVWQELTSRITAYAMFDVCRFAVPFWPVGWLAERLVLGAYLRRFLEGRAAVIRQTAESEEWRSYLPAA